MSLWTASGPKPLSVATFYKLHLKSERDDFQRGPKENGAKFHLTPGTFLWSLFFHTLCRNVPQGFAVVHCKRMFQPVSWGGQLFPGVWTATHLATLVKPKGWVSRRVCDWHRHTPCVSISGTAGRTPANVGFGCELSGWRMVFLTTVSCPDNPERGFLRLRSAVE